MPLLSNLRVESNVISLPNGSDFWRYQLHIFPVAYASRSIPWRLNLITGKSYFGIWYFRSGSALGSLWQQQLYYWPVMYYWIMMDGKIEITLLMNMTHQRQYYFFLSSQRNISGGNERKEGGEAKIYKGQPFLENEKQHSFKGRGSRIRQIWG